MKLGILGGTFNPIHYGHLILAQEAFEQLELDKILFVPTWDPRYKRTTLDYEHRYTMCLNAVGTDGRFDVTDLERSENLTYTVDLLDTLRITYAGYKRYLILGGDQAGQFFVWRSPMAILAMVKAVVVSPRNAYNEGRILDHWAGNKDQLELLDVTPLDISSSLIRDKVERGQEIRYLVPPVIEEYIYSEGLYSRKPLEIVR